MKVSLRNLALLLALVLALVALPSVVMAASGQTLASAAAGVFGSPKALAQWHSPLPTPGGTVPPPTPRPIPPAPVPTRAAPPAPAPARPSTPAAVGTYQIVKVIGDRLSSTIYAFADSGWLYRSDRNGLTWSLVVTKVPVNDFVMSSADPNVLYSGAGQNCASAAVSLAPMYKSTDGGYTWQELPTGLDLTPLLIDPADPDHVFAADCGTLYLSTDGGLTWSPKPASDVDNIWQTYAPVAMDSGSLVGSGGAATTPHWDQLYAIGNDSQGVGVVAFSGDHGDSWANITSPNQSLSGVKAVAASIHEAGRLWVVDSQGVWSTSDYGVNWTLSTQGLEQALRTNASFNDVDYDRNGVLYLATSAGLFVQRGPGGEWTRPSGLNLSSTNLQSVLVTDSNPGRVWVNAEDRDGDPIAYSLFVK